MSFTQLLKGAAVCSLASIIGCSSPELTPATLALSGRGLPEVLLVKQGQVCTNNTEYMSALVPLPVLWAVIHD